MSPRPTPNVVWVIWSIGNFNRHLTPVTPVLIAVHLWSDHLGCMLLPGVNRANVAYISLHISPERKKKKSQFTVIQEEWRHKRSVNQIIYASGHQLNSWSFTSLKTLALIIVTPTWLSKLCLKKFLIKGLKEDCYILVRAKKPTGRKISTYMVGDHWSTQI